MDLTALIGKLIERIPFVEEYRAVRSGRRDHDRAKFAELERLLSEEQLDRFLEAAYQQSIHRDLFEPIDHYLDWSRFTSNCFLTKTIEQLRETFDAELRRLRAFLAVNVFHLRGVPQNDFLYFRPDQNPDYDGDFSGPEREFFDQRVEELNRRIEACDDKYKAFRLAVKNKLNV